MLRHAGSVAVAVGIANNLIRWGGAVAIARYGYLSIVALAGESTFTDIGINVLADLRVSEALAWLLGGTGTAYALVQRKLRERMARQLEDRIVDLEERLRAARASSGLTACGETRTEGM